MIKLNFVMILNGKKQIPITDIFILSEINNQVFFGLIKMSKGCKLQNQEICILTFLISRDDLKFMFYFIS